MKTPIVPFDRAYAVETQSESLLVEAHETIGINWPQQLLLPPITAMIPGGLRIDIKLYKITSSPNAETTREPLATLSPDFVNPGTATITIPDLSNMINATVCPVVIKVEATKTLVNYTSALWTGMKYLITSTNNRPLCEEWSARQPSGEGNNILDRVAREYPCPPTISRVRIDNSGFEEDYKPSQLLPPSMLDSIPREFFHPGSSACYRQSSGFE